MRCLLILFLMVGSVSATFTNLPVCNDAYNLLNASYDTLNLRYNNLNQSYLNLNINYTDLKDDYYYLNQSFSQLNATYMNISVDALRLNITLLQDSLNKCTVNYSECNGARGTFKAQADERDRLITVLQNTTVSQQARIDGFNTEIDSARKNYLEKEAALNTQLLDSNGKLNTCDTNFQHTMAELGGCYENLSLTNQKFGAYCNAYLSSEYYDNYRSLSPTAQSCLEEILKRPEVSFFVIGSSTANSLIDLCKLTNPNQAYTLMRELVDKHFVDQVTAQNIEITSGVSGQSAEMLKYANYRYFPKQLNYGCIETFRKWDSVYDGGQTDGYFVASAFWVVMVAGIYSFFRFAWKRRGA